GGKIVGKAEKHIRHQDNRNYRETWPVRRRQYRVTKKKWGPDNGIKKKEKQEEDQRHQEQKESEEGGKQMLCVRILGVGKEKGPPRKIKHRNDQHHEDSQPVIGLVNADRRTIRQRFQNRPVDHLDDHGRETCRYGRHTERKECPEKVVGKSK